MKGSEMVQAVKGSRISCMGPCYDDGVQAVMNGSRV